MIGALIEEDLRHQLSPQQRKVLDPDVRLVEAGPGAGKTRAIVARFRQQARGSTRGVALLSFTNAAVEEATRRCAEEPELLAPPHFLGTFDQFFHRYVVTPHVMTTSRQAPTYLPSWDDLPDRLARVRGSGSGVGVRLSAFRVQPDGTLGLRDANLRRGEQQFLDKAIGPNRGGIEKQATKRRLELLNRHTYDSHSARRLALRILADDGGSRALALLAERFGEVIVDEFQDCDDSEHRLLELLAKAGVRMVAVADPDQAIYEFRQESKDLYPGFRGKFSEGQVVDLDVCHRSTAAICSAVSSLRSLGKSAILPAADVAPGPDHNYIIVGSGKRITDAAIGVAAQYGIGAHSLKVLAHSTADARKLSHGGIEAPNGSSLTERILTAIIALRTSDHPNLRLMAIRRFERSLLDLFEWPNTTIPGSRRSELDALEVEAPYLRGLVSTILGLSEEWASAEECGQQLRQSLRSELGTLPVPLISTFGNQLSKPNPKVWEYWTKSTEEAAGDAKVLVGWSNIHNVKGAEFDAVVLAIPARARSNTPHVLDDWQNGLNTEQRRVLYVGASRAKKLLMFGVGPNRAKQLAAILDKDRVPHTVVHAK